MQLRVGVPAPGEDIPASKKVPQVKPSFLLFHCSPVPHAPHLSLDWCLATEISWRWIEQSVPPTPHPSLHPQGSNYVYLVEILSFVPLSPPLYRLFYPWATLYISTKFSIPLHKPFTYQLLYLATTLISLCPLLQSLHLRSYLASTLAYTPSPK